VFAAVTGEGLSSHNEERGWGGLVLKISTFVRVGGRGIRGGGRKISLSITIGLIAGKKGKVGGGTKRTGQIYRKKKKREGRGSKRGEEKKEKANLRCFCREKTRRSA